jgi:hypothetical protein
MNYTWGRTRTKLVRSNVLCARREAPGILGTRLEIVGRTGEVENRSLWHVASRSIPVLDGVDGGFCVIEHWMAGADVICEREPGIQCLNDVVVVASCGVRWKFAYFHGTDSDSARNQRLKL